MTVINDLLSSYRLDRDNETQLQEQFGSKYVFNAL